MVYWADVREYLCPILFLAYIHNKVETEIGVLFTS